MYISSRPLIRILISEKPRARLDNLRDFLVARRFSEGGRPARTAHVVGKTVVFLAGDRVVGCAPFGRAAVPAFFRDYSRPAPSYQRLRCPHRRLQAEAKLKLLKKIHRLIIWEYSRTYEIPFLR
jgi:hypothetical protein